MSTHMQQNNQILRTVAAFLFFFLFSFFLCVQLNIMTRSAKPQAKSSVVRSGREIRVNAGLQSQVD